MCALLSFLIPSHTGLSSMGCLNHDTPCPGLCCLVHATRPLAGTPIGPVMPLTIDCYKTKKLDSLHPLNFFVSTNYLQSFHNHILLLYSEMIGVSLGLF